MGPLKGIRIIEIAGLGAAPFAGMLLADMGAEVIQIERPAITSSTPIPDCCRRNKRSVTLDLKAAAGKSVLLRMVKKADVLFEAFRPGVMERLGLGPEECLAANPRLVYGRMTGWGQTGPLAEAAGHDINFISLSGALHAIGEKGGGPVPPLNLVGDYGGGAMFLAAGILAALLHAERTGEGQVVDAAMTDGSALLMGVFHSLHLMGRWETQRGVNLLDGGAHFYGVYETRDGKHVSIGPLEPQFYGLLIDKLGLDKERFGNQHDPAQWPELSDELAAVFKKRTQKQWCRSLEGTDVCFAPVLDFLQATKHPHNVARNTFVTVDGAVQPAPAPRFSRTASTVEYGSRPTGADTDTVLEEWGFAEEEIDELRRRFGQ
ncbi:MAG: CaiB/BaiF CoA-transferase family protein [Pseudomonadota bacterium]